MKSLLVRYISPSSTAWWVLKGIRRNPIAFFVSLARSLRATRKLTGYFWPLKVHLEVGQKIIIHRQANALATIESILRVVAWGGGNSPSFISMGENSKLTIKGDFEIGPGVHITVGKNAEIIIGGRKASSGSGITCNSRVMAEESIKIGSDCIIAWDVFISDSDWHDIKDVKRCDPVVIGDNVWIAHGASVTKGAYIPVGCIVGAKSLVGKAIFPERSLIAGVPASVKRIGVEWSR